MAESYSFTAIFNKEVYNMKQRKSHLFSLLLAFIFIFAAFPLYGLVQASPDEAGFSEKAHLDDYAKHSFDDSEEKSLLSPFDDKGRPLPEKAVKYTPTDDFSTIRVLLNFETTSVTRLNMSLYGAYYIDQNLKPIVGSAQSPAIISMTASGGIVTVYYLGSAVYQGATVDLNRVLLSEAGGYAHLVTVPETQCSDRDYLGNFRITASGNSLRIVNHLPTAHYIYGVVPYEMNDSWGSEALISQAIACKSYAFSYPANASDHDITAYKYHQWYRGYKPGYTHSMPACLNAVGKMLFYNGNVAAAYYGATNGGETTLPSYAFGYSNIDGAYSIALDSYDIQYADPHILELEIQYNAPITNANFRALINDELYAAIGHSTQLLSITHAEVNTRAFPNSELNLTKLDLIVRINDNGVERSQFLRFDVDKLGREGYGVLVPNYERVYRMYWGEELTNGYVIYHCRYGNGIGLAQQAAKGRCANGQDHYEILEFYYPNMDLLSVTERNPELPYSYSKQIAAYGTISTANTRLRSGPSTSDSVLEMLSRGTHVDVITEVNGWLVCIVNNKLGYIRGDLVNVTLFPSPSGGNKPLGTAAVKQGVLDAQLRAGPSEYSSPIMTLYPGVSVQVWHRIGDWYHVRFAGRYAYIHASKVTAPIWNYSKLIDRSGLCKVS